MEGAGGRAMAQQSARAELQVIVAKDAQTAVLSIPANVFADQFTVDGLVAALKSAQVEITDSVLERLNQLVAEPPAAETAHRVTVAEATAPVHGKDGYVQWLIEEEHKPPIKEDGSISFYEQSAYTMVSAGQVIGQVIPPEPGQDGRDVLGKTIASKSGQEADLRLDETIVVNEAAEVVAQLDGVFMRVSGRPTIRQVLEVPGYVDFSTGNIDFHGDVIVRKGVRDLFVVRATGRIETRGLVEAATLDADGDIILAGGMAGRDHGLIRSQSNVIARHLSGTRLEVKGDLLFEKEMMGCDATVRGRVVSQQGSIIGGTLSGAHEIEVAVLGSPAGVETTIQLGSLPLLRARVRKLEEVVSQLGNLLKALVQQRDQLVATEKRLPRSVRDRLIKITEDIRTADEQRKEAQRKHDEAAELIKVLLSFKATISKMLHVGVIFGISRQPMRVHMDVLGPLEIRVAESGQVLVCPEGAAPIPIEKITRPYSPSAAA